MFRSKIQKLNFCETMKKLLIEGHVTLYHSLSIKSKSCTTLASVCGLRSPSTFVSSRVLDRTFFSFSTPLCVCPGCLVHGQPQAHNFWFCTPKPADALPLRHTHVHTAVPSFSQIPWADSVPASSRTHTLTGS